MDEAKNGKKKVALYIRVSTEEQVEMYGKDLQIEALKGLIKSKGYELEFAGDDYIYIDNGVPGSTECLSRTAFSQMIEDLTNCDSETRPFDAVAVYKIDRFARRLKVLLDIFEIFKGNNIEFLSANESIDTSTPFGRAMLGIIGVIAELELENIKTRTHDGRNRAMAQGVFANIPPVGYIKDQYKKILIQKDEAKVVKDIFNMFVYQNMAKNQIADYLTKHKIPSPMTFRHIHKKEKKKRNASKAGAYYWETGAITRILSNELYIGIQYYNKRVNKKAVPKDKWMFVEHDQRIIDTDLFNKAKNLLSKKNRTYNKNRKEQRQNLLQGLIKCANCYRPERDKAPYAWNGTSKKVKDSKRKMYYYSCSNKDQKKSTVRGIKCKTIPLSAEPLENHIVDFIYKLIDNPSVVFKYQQQLQSKKNHIQDLRRRYKNNLRLLNSYQPSRDNIVDLHESSLIGKKEVEKRLNDLDLKQKQYRKEKNQLESQLSIFIDTKEYIKSFEIFKERYKDWFKGSKKKNTDDDLYRLIHMIVDEIIVFSRPKRKTDIVSGRKVEGQMIPYKLKIALRIPSEMLGDLLSSVSDDPEFEADMDTWWWLDYSTRTF